MRGKIFSLLLLLLFMLVIYTLFQYAGRLDRLPKGMTLAGWNVAGMSLEQFQQQLPAHLQQFTQRSMTLINPVSSPPNLKSEASSTLQQLGITVDEEQLMEQIDTLLQGSLMKRVRMRWSMKNKALPLPLQLDRSKLSKQLQAQFGQLQFGEPLSASRIITADDQVRYISEQVAQRFDLEQLEQKLFAQVIPLFHPSSAAVESISVTIPLQTLYPDVTEEMLAEQGIDRKVMEFTTFFRTSGAGRIHNIHATAATIHNYLMVPGELFDYQQVIDRTERERGFKQAPVIIGGRLVPGIGGGICQVSTTLYNAVLRIGLEIVERKNHSLPIRYATLGQDATFASGHINFKFRNSLEHHLLIRVETSDHHITVKLFSSLPDDLRYEIDSKVVEVIEPPIHYVQNHHLQQGKQRRLQPGRPGYIVETYRTTIQAGKITHKERVSRDRYQAKPALIAANPQDIEKFNRNNNRKAAPQPQKQIVEDGVLGPVF